MTILAESRGRFKPHPTTYRQSHSARPVYVGGRVVGHVTPAGAFVKAIRGSKHMLRTPRAIALDLGSIRDAQALGATHAEITDTETGATYQASLGVILRDGREFDRGFGRQIYLPLDAWNRPDLGEQLGLFAELEAGR